MSDPVWKPNTTVAAVVVHEGRFLLVEEERPEGRRFNQPAGHLEHGESLMAACLRETREETGHAVRLTHLLGLYQWSPPRQPELTYLRVSYAAELTAPTAPPAGTTLLNTAFAAELAVPAALPAGVTILNTAFAAEQAAGEVTAALDEGIVRAVWLTYEEVLACRDRHRSPLVLQCIDDYLAGRRFPLDLIRHYE